MRRGEIVAVSFDPAVGSEAAKTRPAVVVSNDAANATATRLGRGVVTVVPVSSNVDRVYPFQVLVPARAPGERIPAGVTAVSLAMTPGASLNAKLPATVTDQATVSKLTALIDGLPRFPEGAYNCPMDNGASLVLTFRAGRSGPVLAVATVKLAGCEGVNLAVRGQQEPGLGPMAGGRSTAGQVLRIAGLH